MQEEIKCFFITETNHDIIKFVTLCLVNSPLNNTKVFTTHVL